MIIYMIILISTTSSCDLFSQFRNRRDNIHDFSHNVQIPHVIYILWLKAVLVFSPEEKLSKGVTFGS